jgi:hypothetical protein
MIWKICGSAAYTVLKIAKTCDVNTVAGAGANTDVDTELALTSLGSWMSGFDPSADLDEPHALRHQNGDRPMRLSGVTAKYLAEFQ